MAAALAFTVGLAAVVGLGLMLGSRGAETDLATTDGPSQAGASQPGTSTSPEPSTPTSEVPSTEPTELPSPEASSTSSPADAPVPDPIVVGAIPSSSITAYPLTNCPNSLLSLTGGTGPETLLDGDPASGWRCDNREDFTEGNINTVPSEGQILQFAFDRDYELTSLEVIEGAAKNAFRWCENGRLQQVQLDFNDGSTPLTIEFPDRKDYPSKGSLYLDFPLEPFRTTRTVTMTVTSIYPAETNCNTGSEVARPWEYGRTARPSEVRFVGRPIQ